MPSFNFKPEYFTIIPGEDRILPLRVINIDGTPFSIDGATEIEARFKKADGGTLSKKLSTSGVNITNGLLGKYSVSLTAAETVLLLIGERQSFSVFITMSSGGVRKVNYRNSLTVERQAV